MGVLELIDQNSRVPPRESQTHLLVAFQQVAGMMEQVVEVEERSVTLVVPIQVSEGAEFCDKALKSERAQVSAKCLVLFSAGLVMGLASGTQMFALGGAPSRCFAGILPLALTAPLLERGLPLFACLRRRAEYKFGNTAPGQRFRCRLACPSGNLRQVFDKFAGRRFYNAAT